MIRIMVMVCGLCLAAQGALAGVYWEHKAWRVSYDPNNCRVWTGGDGSGTFAISMGDYGLEAEFRYQPVVYRNAALPMYQGDEVVLAFDGRISWLSDEVGVLSGLDPYYREPTVSAIMTGGFTNDLVGALRAGNTVQIGVMSYGSPHIIDQFSLSGFTAVWLKAAEWCGFDPRRVLPAS